MGFVLDPPEKIKCLEDTSFYIMKEAFETGHEVFYVDSRDIFTQGTKVLAQTKIVAVDFNDGFREIKSLDGFALEFLDLIFIRKDPPFDSHYLYLTYLLELLKGKVPMLNDPVGIRNANEKLYSLHFPEWIPESTVASNPKTILQFIESVGDVVLKPLNERGGIDILRIGKRDPQRERVIREKLEQYGTLIVQRFLPAVEKSGDKRILVLNGEILGAYVRIPPRGDFRVSVFHDGKYEGATLEKRDREIVESLAPRLIQDGLYFVGLDIIDGFISEINVTSPAGIPEINHFVGEKLEKKVVDFLELFSKH